VGKLKNTAKKLRSYEIFKLKPKLKKIIKLGQFLVNV